MVERSAEHWVGGRVVWRDEMRAAPTAEMSVDEKVALKAEKMVVALADSWVVWKAAQTVVRLVVYLAVHLVV